MNRFFVIILCCLNVFAVSGQKRQLDYFIDQAIKNSPLLKDYNNQVRSNELDSLLLLATQRPQVNITSNDLYAPVIKGFGYDNAITNGANLNALVGVNQSLLNGKNNKIRFNNLRLLSDAIRNNVIISEQDIKKGIISQYITVYGDMLQVNFSTEVQDMLGKQETVLKKLTEKNVYKQVDYLTFYVTIQQHQFLLKQQTNQYKNDYAVLNYLAGIVDTNTVQLDKPDISLAALPDFRQTAFYKKYEIDSMLLVNSKTLLDIGYRPKLNVFADAGYYSSLSYQAYKNFGTSIGLSLVVPIYDGRQKRLQYSKIAYSENTRQANKQFYTNQYNQQIAQLKQQLQATTELIGDINQQLKYIETLITVNEKLLQTGEARIYDYILALSNFLNAKSMLNENTVSRMQLINQINYWNR